MRRSFVIFGLLTIFCASAAFAQQPSQARIQEQIRRSQVDPELWDVLEEWSEKSANVKRLEGEILLRTYDTTFGVERLGEGYFYYASPDKGRLDLNAVPIAPAMLKARNKPDAKVRRKNGVPFKLESEDPVKWICDGVQVISMRVAEKKASVGQLPKHLRGKNIMDGPLPFLFGLPPLEAVNRFSMVLQQKPTQQNPFAKIQAKPRRSEDAKAWKSAQIILDTNTGLPAHVRLVKPAGTLEEIYSFSELKVNARAGRIKEFFGSGDPFKVSLRGYQVNVGETGDDAPGRQPMAADRPDRRVVPDLVGMSYKQASTTLSRLGIKAKSITSYKGKPAQDKRDENRVRRQKPLADTPITREMKVALEFWTVQ
jgi:TIGR03009 family protein